MRRPERILPPGSTLLTGHFHRDSTYGTRRPQGTDDWLLIDTIAGGGRCDSPAGSFALRPGDVIVLRPGHPHGYGTDPAIGRWELVWAHLLVADSWLDLLDWPEPVPGMLHLHLDGAAHRAVTACLRDAHGWTTGAAGRRERLAANAIERALLLLAEANPLDPAGRIDPRLRAAMAMATADLARATPPAAMARAAGLSPSRFAHLFRAQVGLSPARWLERERLQRAAALLGATARSIADVAREVGFADPFYFSQRFRRHAGLPPGAWRVRQRGGRGAPRAARRGTRDAR